METILISLYFYIILSFLFPHLPAKDQASVFISSSLAVLPAA